MLQYETWFADITIAALKNNCLDKLKSSTALHIQTRITPIKSIQNFLNMTKRNVQIFKRFADDCFIVAKNDELPNLLNVFNSHNPSIQFTIEIENNKKLNFLDLDIIPTDNYFAKRNWYKKRTPHTLNENPVSAKLEIFFLLYVFCR